MLDATGVCQLRKLIVSHFGNRAFLIKFNTGLQQIKAACFQIQQNCDRTSLQILREIAARVESIEANAHEFQELRILRSYYARQLDFDANEVQQLLDVTGESGISCAQRLGLSERSNVIEMLSVAQERMHYWRSRVNDYMSTDSHTLEAARILSFSFQRIFYHLTEAKKYLYL